MNRWVLGLLLGMGALIAMSGAEIVRLRAQLDAQPAIEQSKRVETRTGPKTITTKTRLIPQAGGLPPIKEKETVTQIASQEKVADSLIKETPALVLAPKPIRSRVGLDLAPLAFGASKAASAIKGVDCELIFWQTLGVGAGWQFSGKLEERPRVKLSYYFY